MVNHAPDHQSPFESSKRASIEGRRLRFRHKGLPRHRSSDRNPLDQSPGAVVPHPDRLPIPIIVEEELTRKDLAVPGMGTQAEGFHSPVEAYAASEDATGFQ
jgi:hypothetical protein